ncbi:MAG: hypothetical protein ACHQ1D_10830, partial [Nitrososphaerales archaeon]
MAGKRPTRPDESNQNSKEVNNSLLNNNIIINKLNVIYTNADCLTNKRTELMLLVQSLSCKPDVVVVTEVNSKTSKNKMLESEFHMEGFNLFSVNVGEIHSRGIIVFLSKTLSCSQVDINEKFQECLFIQIKGVNCRNLLIGALYRSPNCTADNDVNL